VHRIRFPCVGFSAALVRNLPYGGIFFTVFEEGKALGARLNGTGKPSNLETFAAGGAAGLVGWSVVYPTDVIKSSMQTDRSFLCSICPCCFFCCCICTGAMLWTVDAAKGVLQDV